MKAFCCTSILSFLIAFHYVCLSIVDEGDPATKLRKLFYEGVVEGFFQNELRVLEVREPIEYQNLLRP
jgi:hypothetical protein